MSAAVGEDLRSEPAQSAAPVRPRAGASRWLAVVVVGLVVSPVVVAGLSIFGDTWYPVGDWASMLFRTGQVGSGDTPLMGTYTVKGWAHPGPFLYYATAPLYRLTAGDPRSMAWTAAIVNSAALVSIGAVAWRRGRLALTVAVMVLAALLVRGFGPKLLVDLWNPYLGLLPFLLVVILAWDAALGTSRSVVLAAIPATIAIQCHVSFAPLIGVVAVWLFCWCRWWPRLVPGDAGSSHDVVDASPPRPPWTAWRSAVVRGTGLAAILSLPALYDLVFDTHNLASVVGHLAVGSGEQIGPKHGLGLVSRYTRPDGPWLGGVEPSSWNGIQGSGPFLAVLVVAMLVGCVYVGRRRRLVDVAALATLTLTLVVASIPAAANLVQPLFGYLTQWLKIVGGLVWFTVAWTAWRVFASRVRTARVHRCIAALACVGLVAAVGSTWGEATRVELPAPVERAAVQDLRGQLDGALARDLTYRVEGRADAFGFNAAGVIYYLIEDGYDVVTADGGPGLKWGHTHSYSAGDHYDVRLTVAVHYGGSWHNAYLDCMADPAVELVASYDNLARPDRARLEAISLERRTSPETITDADRAEAQRLQRNGLRVGVFAGERDCGTEDEPGASGDDD